MRLPPLTTAPLPEHLVHPGGTYWQPSYAFLDELVAYLRGKRVLEVFAGNGYMAGWLARAGVDIKATSRFSGHDAHERGLYHDVEELDAVEAVARYGQAADVLLICWPTTTPAVLRAAQRWGANRPIVYIGEVTKLELNQLAGCATDEFFYSIQEGPHFKSYHGRGFEVAMVCELKGSAAPP